MSSYTQKLLLQPPCCFSVTRGSNHQAFVSSQVPPPDGSIMKLQRERVGRLSIKMRLEFILSVLRKRGLLQTRQNKLGSAVCLLKLSLNWRYKKHTVACAYCGNTKSVALSITEWIQINIEHYTTESDVQKNKKGEVPNNILKYSCAIRCCEKAKKKKIKKREKKEKKKRIEK